MDDFEDDDEEDADDARQWSADFVVVVAAVVAVVCVADDDVVVGAAVVFSYNQTLFTLGAELKEVVEGTEITLPNIDCTFLVSIVPSGIMTDNLSPEVKLIPDILSTVIDVVVDAVIRPASLVPLLTGSDIEIIIPGLIITPASLVVVNVQVSVKKFSV